MDSVIYIIDAQKEKCDELRQQHHVLHERLAYLCLLRETLSCRQSTSSAGLPDERVQEEHQLDETGADVNDAVVTLISNAAVQICGQFNTIELPCDLMGETDTVAPPPQDDHQPAQTSLTSATIDVLNQLRVKVTALVEQAKSLAKNHQVNTHRLSINWIIQSIASPSPLLPLLLLLFQFFFLINCCSIFHFVNQLNVAVIDRGHVYHPHFQSKTIDRSINQLLHGPITVQLDTN